MNYVKPTTVVIEIRYSGLLCSSPDPNLNAAFFLGGGGSYDEGSIWDNGDY